MHRHTLSIVVAGLALTTGCYHATIETGRPPSPVVIDQQWAKGFVYGLVPPDAVSTMERCPSGVSKVETEHSFLNMLAGALTGGIFTPMHITVTCAAAARSSAAPAAPWLDYFRTHSLDVTTVE